MVVRFEPLKLIIDNLSLESLQVLQRAQCDVFFHKFSGFNAQVTQQFANKIEGEKIQIGNLTLPLSEC